MLNDAPLDLRGRGGAIVTDGATTKNLFCAVEAYWPPKPPARVLICQVLISGRDSLGLVSFAAKKIGYKK